MPPPNDRPSGANAARLLKGAALTIALLGAGMAAWGIDKWIRYPEIRARQFGLQAPLWPAFTIFVLVATAVIVWLLWTTAWRVEQGEDLFAHRHRRGDSPRDVSQDEQESER